MSWQLVYAVFGAPLLMLLAGLAAVWIHSAIERRDRRLYDDRGYLRVRGRERRS